MLNHARSSHPYEFAIASGENPSSQPKPNQLKLADSFARTFEQSQYETKLIEMVVANNLSMKLIESPSFKDLVKYLNPRANNISGKTMKVRLLTMFNETKQQLAQQLAKNSSKISFTTDGWTGKNSAQFIAVTATYITENFDFKNILLDFVEIRGSHTGARLSQAFEEIVFEDYQLLSDKIGGVCMDNASNNSRMMEIFCQKHSVDCRARLECMAHSINLAVKAGMKCIQHEIEILRHGIRSIRASPKLLQRLEVIYGELAGNMKDYLVLELDCPTRWNATVKMLKTALRMKRSLQVGRFLSPKNIFEILKNYSKNTPVKLLCYGILNISKKSKKLLTAYQHP